MRKNGFTLIELLAVIVILAIIALIATPIILGIINDAREKANERSVELYASAVRNGIAAYQLTNTDSPKTFSDLNVQYDGDVKCSVQELYEDGSFYLEGCKINNGEKEYSYGTKQGASFEVGKMSICNPIDIQTEGTYTAGDKYECDVDPNKEGYDYTFYILNSTTTEVNLIMDSNINIRGEAVKEGVTDLGLVAWISQKDYPGSNWDAWEDNNTYGPITAMNYLTTATENWTNVLSINETYDDETGQFTDFGLIGNARMPKLSEVSDYDGNNSYLYDNLQINCYNDECTEYDGVQKEGINHISSVYGYWTLSASTSFFSRAWYVYHQGYVSEENGNLVESDKEFGVRPVINLSI